MKQIIKICIRLYNSNLGKTACGRTIEIQVEQCQGRYFWGPGFNSMLPKCNSKIPFTFILRKRKVFIQENVARCIVFLA